MRLQDRLTSSPWSCLLGSELVSQRWTAVTNRSIADILATKIGLKLKKNPDSSPDYQHLLVELESLD